MKKTVWIFGTIAGVLLAGFALYHVNECYTDPDMQPNDVVGYAGMIAVFSFVFIGIKNYRDKYHGGFISFGQAFLTGFYICLIASAVYVVTWLVDYYIFVPDFLDKYIPHVLKEASRSGATELELKEKAAEMAEFKEMYKNPLFVIVVSFGEVLPVGLIVALISALILKKKRTDPTPAAAQG